MVIFGISVRCRTGFQVRKQENNNDMSVIFDYTDDEHLRLITNKLIEYKNSEFVQRLKNVKYIEDIKELVTIMPNDDVFDTYIMSIVKQNV